MKKTFSSLHDVLTRQVAEVLPSRAGLERAMAQKKIRLYLGVDPTAPYLHLGHTILLRKLRQFQELGHQVILLFGTFTAQIGDPSGRDIMRKPLTEAEIAENMATYQEQAAKILDFSKIEMRHNGDWLSELRFKDILALASHFTVSQLLERDMFQERIKKGDEVWVHEFLYPLMQGYDSVAMDVDLEIGGTDQTFNMLVGRKLQQIYHGKEKFLLTTKMLIGLDGRKMSKTYRNTVNILDTPKDMYGKLMTLRDELMAHYFEMCTEVPMAEVQRLEQDMKTKKIAARDLKARLAREIVTLYHGVQEAEAAELEFLHVFREKKLPQDIVEVKITPSELLLADLLVQARLAPSKAEARRLAKQGGVKIDGKVHADALATVHIAKGMVVQVGKRKFAKIV